MFTLSIFTTVSLTQWNYKPSLAKKELFHFVLSLCSMYASEIFTKRYDLPFTFSVTFCNFSACGCYIIRVNVKVKERFLKWYQWSSSAYKKFSQCVLLFLFRLSFNTIKKIRSIFTERFIPLKIAVFNWNLSFPIWFKGSNQHIHFTLSLELWNL